MTAGSDVCRFLTNSSATDCRTGGSARHLNNMVCHGCEKYDTTLTCIHFWCMAMYHKCAVDIAAGFAFPTY